MTWTGATAFCFTAADGLNITTYTLCSLVFTVQVASIFNLCVGAQGAGVTQQSIGTVYAYGWKILYYNRTNNINGSLTMPGTLTCSSLKVNTTVIPTPAYIRLQNITSPGTASASTDIIWSSILNSGITLSGSTITIPTIGVYLFGGKVSLTTALTSASSF